VVSFLQVSRSKSCMHLFPLMRATRVSHLVVLDLIILITFGDYTNYYSPYHAISLSLLPIPPFVVQTLPTPCILTALLLYCDRATFTRPHKTTEESVRFYTQTLKAFRCSTGTYASRGRRSLSLPEPPLDVAAVEKRLIAELGEHVCVFERVCDQYAEHARTLHGSNHVLNWGKVFK